jgi:hypothetical protein
VKLPQTRHPERSASQIVHVTQLLWRGVEEPVPRVAEGTSAVLISPMLLGAFRPPKPTIRIFSCTVIIFDSQLCARSLNSRLLVRVRFANSLRMFFVKLPQTRHPERSASQIVHVTQLLRCGVEEPVPRAAEGTSAVLILPMLLGAFRPPKPTIGSSHAL